MSEHAYWRINDKVAAGISRLGAWACAGKCIAMKHQQGMATLSKLAQQDVYGFIKSA